MITSSTNINTNEKINNISNELENNFDKFDMFHNFLFRKNLVGLAGDNECINCFGRKSEEELENNLNKNRGILLNFINGIKEKDIFYRPLSCIYGAFLGDATGAYCEFMESSPHNSNNTFRGNPMFGESAGQVTDDSEMAMSMAYGIMETPTKDTLNSAFLYYYYGLWYLSGPSDIGNTTRVALSLLMEYQFDPHKTSFNYFGNHIIKHNSGSLANGFLMRISPFIVWFYIRNMEDIQKAFSGKDVKLLFDLYIKIKNEAMKDNACTHPSPETASASACFTLLALGAIVLEEPKGIIGTIKNMYSSKYFENQNIDKNDINVRDAFLSCEQFFSMENFNAWDFFTKYQSVTSQMGYYMHAFRLTIHYLINFNNYEENKYENIMNEICNFGGDTDTNAAIVGAVIGPIIGYKNFSKHFAKMIELIPKNRKMYSPIFMVLYVDYLLRTNDKKEKTGNYFLKMILTLLYGEVSINNKL